MVYLKGNLQSCSIFMPYTLRKRLLLYSCFGTLSVIFVIVRLHDIKKSAREHSELQPLTAHTTSEIIANFDTSPLLLLSVNSATTTGKDDTTAKTDDNVSQGTNSADELSQIVQTELTNLQNPTNCSAPTLLCGHRDLCGLVCQIHHRIACLMISYATGIPLIHDVTTGWPYATLWDEIFYPLDSSCTPGPNTRKLNPQKSEKYVKAINSTGPDFPFPLAEGIVVPKDLADKVESFHSDPFFWWIGQFMKYGLRLLPAKRKMVQDAQDSIKFAQPIVGYMFFIYIDEIHIRRTDKRYEDHHFFHPIQEYFAVAEQYYMNLTKQGIPFDVKRVFLASDDQSLLLEAKRLYKAPEWNVIGFHHGRTLSNQFERIFALDQMVKDLFTLADCDFVVCTYNSNVCRALAGMLHINHADGLQGIKSIDNSPYSYLLLDHSIPMKIIKK